MNTKVSSRKDVLHNLLCWSLLLGFFYFWFFTVSLVFFNRRTRLTAPGQSELYSSFFNQNWRLFSKPKKYSKELNFVIRTINAPSETDTIYLEKYLMQQKRHHAPFNSYDDALERAFNSILTDLDRMAGSEKKLLQKKLPGKEDDFYVQQLFTVVENDKHQKENIENIIKYGKYILAQKQIDTTGKEFRIAFVRNYMLPAQTPVANPANSNTETIFISTYKPF